MKHTNRHYALFVDDLMDSTDYKDVDEALAIASEIISDMPKVSDIKITYFPSGALLHHWNKGSWLNHRR